MEDDDSRCLTATEQGEDDAQNVELHEFRTPNIEPKRNACIMAVSSITVEPVLFGSMLIIIMYSMLEKEYIFSALSREYGLINKTEESCNSSLTNKSDPQHQLEEKVSEETSKWILYLNVATYTISSISTVIYGYWSDQIGRKIPLFISCFGLVGLMLVYVLVINLNLHVSFLLIGHIFTALCGDFGTILACGFAYISDVTDEKRRTLRVAVGEACLGLGGLLASIGGGYWVHARGFKEPFWFLLGIAIGITIYTFFCIKGRRVRQAEICASPRVVFQPFIDVFHILTQSNGSKRYVSIWLYTVCTLLLMSVNYGMQDVLVVYEIGLPFCWSYSTAGIASALLHVGYLVSVAMIKLFRGVTAEMWLVVLDAISNMSSSIALMFSSMTWHIFLGVVLKLCGRISIPVIRSQLSRVVAKDEVGTAFSLLSLAQNIAALLASFLYNGIFALTVNSSLPGAVFSLGFFTYAIFLVLFCIVFRMSKAFLQTDGANKDTGGYHIVEENG